MLLQNADLWNFRVIMAVVYHVIFSVMVWMIAEIKATNGTFAVCNFYDIFSSNNKIFQSKGNESI